MKFITTTFLFFLSLNIFAQIIEPNTLISHANYYRSSQGVFLQSSFGELTTQTFLEGSSSITQGFIQTYSQLVPIDEDFIPNLKVKVGPIPCTNFFIIEKNTEEILTSKLLDINGRLLKTDRLIAEETQIDVSHLASGSYFLILYKEQKQIFKTMKIVKTK